MLQTVLVNNVFRLETQIKQKQEISPEEEIVLMAVKECPVSQNFYQSLL